MKVKNALLSSVLVLTASTFIVTENVIAENYKKIAVEMFEGLTISFSEQRAVSNATLSISGPNGFVANSASENDIPSINLSDFGTLSDGRYKYQITSSALGDANKKITSSLNNGRASDAPKIMHKSVSQSGYFYLEDGQVKQFVSENDLNQTTLR